MLQELGINFQRLRSWQMLFLVLRLNSFSDQRLHSIRPAFNFSMMQLAIRRSSKRLLLDLDLPHYRRRRLLRAEPGLSLPELLML